MAWGKPLNASKGFELQWFWAVIVNLDSMTVICDNTVMVIGHTTSFTLEELSEEVARTLCEHNLISAQQDNRVSAAPDVRTIRYYTTLGLIDRPSIEGRVARYRRRHLLQLLAIKALQGLSMPLSDIQARLYSLGDAELEGVIEAVAASIRATEGQKEISQATSRPVVWREIVIEPGLKISAEEGWVSQLDEDVVLQRLIAALTVLRDQSKRANGGLEG